MKSAPGRLATLFGLALLTCLAHAEPVLPVLRFGLFGDTPYSAYERRQLPLLLADMAQAGLAFIVHDGDIKSGGSRCDDAVYRDIRGVFDDSALPLVYVPGDNEWSDCSRAACGGFDPLERLDFLRRVFFAGGRSLGKTTIALEQQPGTPENLRWRAGPVLFVSLNMPGHDNNVSRTKEYAARNRTNLAWLRESFAQAKAAGLPGLLLVTQANPFIEDDNAGATHAGFKDFLDLLRAETEAFPGQVALVHGDTHNMQINRPLRDKATGRTVANFVRVETYGAPFMGWIEGSVDATDPQLFRFQAHPWPPADGR
ncbi:hypothetical protein [Denitratisoma sp. agr-D3]